MKYGLILNDEGRILSVGIYHQGFPDDVEQVDVLPEGDHNSYLYIDGEYIYDPQPEEEPVHAPTAEERITELEEALALLLSGVTE